MNYDLEYDLKEFREEEKELFDKKGYRYRGVCMSDRQAEKMLRLINLFEKEIIKLENEIIKLNSKGFDE